MRSPVLFVVFNRPDTTRQVFAAIRDARPPRLYVTADGPRRNREGEAVLCEEVRRIASAVDWPCELKTFFRDENQGCKKAVTSGIDWFFNNEEEGIVLEDDILPMPSFFWFCDEMLDRYRHDSKVAMISGSNLISDLYCIPESYLFSRMINAWGWASWRREWQGLDMEMSLWPEVWKNKKMSHVYRDSLRMSMHWNLWIKYIWKKAFDYTCVGEIDTWDYQWLYSSWNSCKMTILPKVNLIKNIGFGTDATHNTVKSPPDYMLHCIPRDLVFPLVHPNVLLASDLYDLRLMRDVYEVKIVDAIRAVIKDVPLINNILASIRRVLMTLTYDRK